MVVVKSRLGPPRAWLLRENGKVRGSSHRHARVASRHAQFYGAFAGGGHGEDRGGREGGGGLDEGGRAGRGREIAVTLAGGCPDGETAPHSQGPAIDQEPQLLMVRHKDLGSVSGVLRRKRGGDPRRRTGCFGV